MTGESDLRSAPRQVEHERVSNGKGRADPAVALCSRLSEIVELVSRLVRVRVERK
jgi:hypothetical protein